VLRGTFFAVVGAAAVLLVCAHATAMTRLVWVLERLVALAAIGVLVIFQPEIRRGLLRLGQGTIANLFARRKPHLVDEVVAAAVAMSKRKIGALVAIQRDGSLGEYIEGGVRMESHLSSELLVSVFVPGSPLHDGAAIVRGGRIAAAGCLLPLTDNPDISKALGTRHRAGIGLSERTDAVAVIVSEQTGTISVGVRGELMQGLSVEDLRGILHKLCVHLEEDVMHAG
jgi:diadenylate cyclase